MGTRVLTALLRQDFDSADSRLTAGINQLPGEATLVGFEALLHATRRDPARAIEAIGRALASPRCFGHTHHVHYTLACVYSQLGDTEQAMAWLERSVDNGFACWPFFRVDPFLANLRREPAFTRLVASLEQTYTAIDIRKL